MPPLGQASHIPQGQPQETMGAEIKQHREKQPFFPFPQKQGCQRRNMTADRLAVKYSGDKNCSAASFTAAFTFAIMPGSAPAWRCASALKLSISPASMPSTRYRRNGAEPVLPHC